MLSCLAVFSLVALAAYSMSPASAQTAAGPNGPSGLKEEGIYLEVGPEGAREFVQLSLVKPAGVKHGGTAKNLLTGGLSGSKLQFMIRYPQAENRVASPQPVFYVVRLDPRDITVIKMEREGRDKRIFTSAKIKSGGISMADSEEQFLAEKISQGLYRLTFPRPLEAGEYGFGVLVSGNMGTMLNVFDFGIDAPATTTASR